MRTNAFMDIIRKAQLEGKKLAGFTQSMCSMIKKGKSCVKNTDTVEWLSNFFKTELGIK
jgi:hypothetical protein